MRRSTTICLLLLWATLTMAQDIRFGLTAGFIASKPVDYQEHVGFQIGGKAEIPLAKNIPNLYLAPSLTLTSKGWKDEVYDEEEDRNTDWTCNAYYLELPILVGFNILSRNNYQLVLEFGPYVAYGLFGNSKIKGKGEEFEIDNIFSSVYRRFDYGFMGQVGVDVKQWQFCIGYSGSLQRPTRGEWAGISPKDVSYSLKATYFF